jgi:hypothetical protein
MKRDGIASDNGRKPAAALLRDELVANEAGKPESNHTVLLARMLERGNLQRALKRVRQSQGAPGTHAIGTGLWQATDFDPLNIRFPPCHYLSKLWNLRSFAYPLQSGNGFLTA